MDEFNPLAGGGAGRARRRAAGGATAGAAVAGGGGGAGGRGSHLSTFQLNLSRVGHTSPCPPV